MRGGLFSRIAAVRDETVRRFLEERLHQGLARSTVTLDELALRRLMRWMQGRRLSWHDLTPRRMSEYLDSLQRRRAPHGSSSSRTLAVGTILAHVRTLRVWFRYLMAHDVLLLDPTCGIQIPSRRVLCGRGVFRQDEVLAILDALSGDALHDQRDRTIVSLLYGTGMRIGELVALDVGDCDASEGSLLIRCGKGQKSRAIPVGPTVQQDLAVYLARVRPQLARKGSAALFLSARGDRLGGPRVTQHLKDVQRHLGIWPVRATHALRHAFATHLLAEGADITALQKFLGHARLETTAIYTTVDLADLRRVLRLKHPRERRS